MPKSADAFRTISEVADWLEVPAHVLRFWESKFSQVKPVKRAGGRRYYRPNDMLLLGGIKKFLHDDGMTIKGAQKLLREQGVKYVAGYSQPLDEISAAEVDEISLDVIADTVSPPDAKVLDFKRDTEKATPAKAASGKAASNKAGPKDEPATPDESAPPTESTPPTMSETAGANTAAEPDESAPAAEVTSKPAPTGRPKPDAKPVVKLKVPDLPSFMRHPTTDRPAEPVQDTGPPSEPENTADIPPDQPAAKPPQDEAEIPAPPPRQPVKIDVPADPADDLPAEPGVLTHLANLKRPISRQAAALLAPYIERLHSVGTGNPPDHSD